MCQNSSRIHIFRFPSHLGEGGRRPGEVREVREVRSDDMSDSARSLINLQKMGTVRRCHPLYDDEGNLIGNLLFREERVSSCDVVSTQSPVETSHSNNLPKSISPELRAKYDLQMHNLLKKPIKDPLKVDISGEASPMSQKKGSSLKSKAEENPYHPYLNQFHKESTERKLAELEEQRKSPLNAQEEVKKHFEMHKRLAETYPEDNN